MRNLKHILKYNSIQSVIFETRNYCAHAVKKTSSQKIKIGKLSLNPADSPTPYYFEDGLRKVYPFHHRHAGFCKERWLGKTILDMYCEEFALASVSECKDRITKGLVQVNNETVPLDYTLKQHDFISARVHKHELAILPCPIEVLYEDDYFFVVNKPPSVPIHPCGLYYNNSLLCILANEHKRTDLHFIHRLDRLASGVLVLAKTSQKSRELHKEMDQGGISKEYVCRVEGNFPDGKVICNKPIKKFQQKIGVSLVHSQGKTAYTEFKKLSYNGKSSIVLCKPYTGRTHQIRVHLQYLGHPVLNDPVYNSYVFGALKGKNGMIEKPISQLFEDLLDEHYSEWGFEKPVRNEDLTKEKNYLNYTLFKDYYANEQQFSSEKDDSRFTYDEHCYFCKRDRNPEQTALGLFLHACKYESKDWSFQAPMPFWASEDWNKA